MAVRERLFWILLVIVLAALLMLLQCQPRGTGALPGAAVNLEPNDPRPVYQVAVADSDEVSLLQQELKLEVLRYEPGRLYFHANEAQLARLPEYGYSVMRANPYDVYYRVVRVAKKGERSAMKEYGVRFINEEKGYWVVRGSLTALRSMRHAGYRLGPIEGDEPRPRAVRITVKKPEDVQRVAALHVDIYSVTGIGKRPKGPDDFRPEEPEPIHIYAAAFDDQIERLRELGFTVEMQRETEEPEVP